LGGELSEEIKRRIRDLKLIGKDLGLEEVIQLAKEECKLMKISKRKNLNTEEGLLLKRPKISFSTVKKFCSFCKRTNHNTNECFKINTTSNKKFEVKEAYKSRILFKHAQMVLKKNPKKVV